MQVYSEARKTVTWHYQWIVVNEYLPLICGKAIVDNILGHGRKFYCPKGEPFIPVEFSVAAYRFGHSMIAQSMVLKPGATSHTLFSSQIGRGFSKITSQNQVVDWSQFFDISATHQKAEKLDTKLASDLLDLPFVNSSNSADKSLATRNLRRAQSFLLPSGEEVAKAMSIEMSQIDRVTNLIDNLTRANNIELSSGTPLWFYILAEAEEIGRNDTTSITTPGEGLGPVGATIVAEVIIGLLELDTSSYLGGDRDWVPKLGTNNEFFMKDLVAKAMTAI